MNEKELQLLKKINNLLGAIKVDMSRIKSSIDTLNVKIKYLGFANEACSREITVLAEQVTELQNEVFDLDEDEDDDEELEIL